MSVQCLQAFACALCDHRCCCCSHPCCCLQGTAFYALHSCINHSCRPNAEARCRPDGALQVVALTPIAVGEEVVISYIDESEGYAARQSALRDYGFACRCEACVQEAVQE